jgi:hypothetical protein
MVRVSMSISHSGINWLLRLVCASVLAICSLAIAQDNYSVIQVADGGTISGSVKWSGPKPHLAVAAITKDAEICDPKGGKTAELDRLIIGSDGGVANTVVYLKNISSGKAFDFPAARQFLDQKHCRYEPHILLVPQTTALQMKNSDAILHLVHMEGAETYNLPFPFPNQVISRPMNHAGIANLRCNGGHTWMNGIAVVAPHPYYAVTDANGQFELTNVPPGQYQIVAWHEGWDILRHEDAFDVLTEKPVTRVIFSDPKTWTKTVTVGTEKAATVNFMISSE